MWHYSTLGWCVLRGVEESSIYTSGGQFPPNARMEGNQETWSRLLLEMHLDERPAKYGRPVGSADPTLPPLVLILLWQADLWAHNLILSCKFRGALVCSARWALLVRE